MVLEKYAIVAGAGLAGCEAALQLANRGIKTILYEMKPEKYSPAHKLPTFCELVCSNSLKSTEPSNAHGLLKQELLKLKSFLIDEAFKLALPAGKSLSVDRKIFSERITDMILSNKNITVKNEEFIEIQESEITIISAGPLISDRLFENLKKNLSADSLYFFDAIAPIIYSDSIDFNNNSVIIGNRYGEQGTGDYLNILLNKDEYSEFYDKLISAAIHNPEHFEENRYFQGCMPVEQIAKSGFDTLRFGTMKPVGFHYSDGSKPFAVIQLRKENSEGSIYNMVGFQTRLKYGEQERIFRTLPGLEKAEFARKGSMHRNSYINSPVNLTSNLNLKNNSNIFIAGQLTGVEGYVESIATGLIAGINAANILNSQSLIQLPEFSMINSLISYISNPDNSKDFQPMNAIFGLMKPLNSLIKNKKERYLKYAERSLNSF